MLTLGTKGKAEIIVDETKLARSVGSGDVALLSSPIMIALMEQAAWTSVQPDLDEGFGTVGIFVSARHNRATPIGLRVWAESELTEIRGKRLIFTVHAFDERGPIGDGTHERVIVETAPFEASATEG